MWFLLLPNVFVVIKYFSLCLLLLFYVLQLAAIFFRWLCVDACDEGSEGRENRFFLQATSWLIANQRQFKGNKKYLFEINFFLFLLACLLACLLASFNPLRHRLVTRYKQWVKTNWCQIMMRYNFCSWSLITNRIKEKEWKRERKNEIIQMKTYDVFNMSYQDSVEKSKPIKRSHHRQWMLAKLSLLPIVIETKNCSN